MAIIHVRAITASVSLNDRRPLGTFSLGASRQAGAWHSVSWCFIIPSPAGRPPAEQRPGSVSPHWAKIRSSADAGRELAVSSCSSPCTRPRRSHTVAPLSRCIATETSIGTAEAWERVALRARPIPWTCLRAPSDSQTTAPPPVAASAGVACAAVAAAAPLLALPPTVIVAAAQRLQQALLLVVLLA